MAALSPAERPAIRGCDVAHVPQSAAAAFNPMTRIMEQVIEMTRIYRVIKPEQARVRAVELFRAPCRPIPPIVRHRTDRATGKPVAMPPPCERRRVVDALKA